MQREQPTIMSQIERGEREKQRRPQKFPRPRIIKVLLFLAFLQTLCALTAGITYLFGVLGILNALIQWVEGITITVWAVLAFIVAFMIAFLVYWWAGILYDDWQEHYIQLHEEAHLRAIHHEYWKFPT